MWFFHDQQGRGAFFLEDGRGVYCAMVGRGLYFDYVGMVNLLGRSAGVIISLLRKIGGF